MLYWTVIYIFHICFMLLGGLLENMCHEGVVKEAEDLYLASNIYFQNKNKDDDCFCKVSTTCGSHIIFEAVDIRLSRMAGGGCGERITFSDVKHPNDNRSVTCYDKYLQMKPVFETISNVGYVHMNVLDERNLGHVWIHVTCKYRSFFYEFSLETVSATLCMVGPRTIPISGMIGCV